MYKPPTPDELKSIIFWLGLSRSETGKLADVAGKKIGMWAAGKGQMPYSVLFTIVTRSTGQGITPENWRSEWQQIIQD